MKRREVPEVAREIEFIVGVREGLNELDRGQGVPILDVETMIEEWTTSSPRAACDC